MYADCSALALIGKKPVIPKRRKKPFYRTEPSQHSGEVELEGKPC